MPRVLLVGAGAFADEESWVSYCSFHDCGCEYEEASREALETERRLIAITCESLGHRSSKWFEFKDRSGKEWRWKSCLRCGVTVAGEHGKYTSALGEMLGETYNPEAIGARMAISSEFYKALTLHEDKQWTK